MEYELKPFSVENQRDVHRCQGLGDTGVATSSLYLPSVCRVWGCTSFTLAVNLGSWASHLAVRSLSSGSGSGHKGKPKAPIESAF